MSGSVVTLNNAVGTSLVQYPHGFLELLGRFLSRLCRVNRFHGRADLILFRGITNGTALDTADIFHRRLDDRHGSSNEINDFNNLDTKPFGIMPEWQLSEKDQPIGLVQTKGGNKLAVFSLQPFAFHRVLHAFAVRNALFCEKRRLIVNEGRRAVNHV